MKMKFSNIILVAYLSIILIGTYLVLLGARSYSREKTDNNSVEETMDNSVNMTFDQPIRHIVAKDCDMQFGLQMGDGKEMQITAFIEDDDGTMKREPRINGDTLFIQGLHIYQLVLNQPLLSVSLVECEMNLTTNVYSPNGVAICHLDRSHIDFHSADILSRIDFYAENSGIRFHCENGFTDSLSVILKRSSFSLENQNAEGSSLGNMDIQYVPSDATIQIPTVYLPRTSFTELKR